MADHKTTPKQRMDNLVARLRAENPGASQREIAFLFVEQVKADAEMTEYALDQVFDHLDAEAEAMRRDGTREGPITVEELLEMLQDRQIPSRARH